MKKINTRLDSITNPLYSLAPWFFRIALGVAFFIHGYKKLPAPFMMEEQHRMVTWFESMFMPFPELIVSNIIFDASSSSSFVDRYCCIAGLTRYKPFGCKTLGTLISDKGPDALPNETIIPLIAKHSIDPSNVSFPTPS